MLKQLGLNFKLTITKEKITPKCLYKEDGKKYAEIETGEGLKTITGLGIK